MDGTVVDPMLTMGGVEHRAATHVSGGPPQCLNTTTSTVVGLPHHRRGRAQSL